MMWSCSGREQGPQVPDLTAVADRSPRTARWGPSRRRPSLGLQSARGQEVPFRLQSVRPQVGPVGVRPVHRVTQHHDQPGVRHRRGDPPVGLGVLQVEGGALPAEGTGRGAFEEGLVVLPAPHPFASAVGVTRTAVLGRRTVAEEVLRLLHGRQVELGMPLQGRVEGGRPRLGGTDDEEVRKRHRPSVHRGCAVHHRPPGDGSGCAPRWPRRRRPPPPGRCRPPRRPAATRGRPSPARQPSPP